MDGRGPAYLPRRPSDARSPLPCPARNHRDPIMRNLPVVFWAATIAVGFSIALASTAAATERRATYVGRPRVVDGDTLAIGSDRLRLWGVDAPEIRQQCLRNGQAFLCWEHVAEALRTYIGRDQVRCDYRDWNPARALNHE